MTPRNLERLAKKVRTRRLELHPSRLAAAAAAGISKDTWRRVEEGEVVREVTYAKIDGALQWAPGSCIAITEGDEPVPVERIDDSALTQMPPAMLPEEVREAVQASVMITTPGLTVREMHALSDQVVKELQRRGRLPKAT
ncbi:MULTISPECIES: hypothetical protein [unclassified Streptomyces]|uniref:hypothetical protein n=1 Tax=unclassified Streptomyces TaxID=2593676 RepID=UPI0038144DA7